MALFASKSLPSGLVNGMEKLGLGDAVFNGSYGPDDFAQPKLDPLIKAASEVSHPCCINHKEPMHSILKHPGCCGGENPEVTVSTPVDVPLPIKRSSSAGTGSPTSSNFGTSPGGSHQDMWRLWADDCEAGNSEFPSIMPPARRSLSLKSNKTPPGTPSPKKMVRFADAMGLDLEKVRHFFQDQLPTTGVEDSPISSLSNDKGRHMTSRYMTATFPQPCLSCTFLDRIRNQKVCLDSVQTTDFVITGLVRVLNISFEKSVVLRYTFDSWKCTLDTIAQYVANSNDNFSDRFQFVLHAPTYFEVGQTLQFAICYRAGSTEFWDNNYGQNYSLVCCAGAESIPGFNALPHSPSTNAFL